MNGRRGWLITSTDGTPIRSPRTGLAKGKCVTWRQWLVIAETRDQVKDAEMIEVDYDVLPAVVNVVDAQGGRSTEAPGNKCYHWALKQGATDAAFAKGAHVRRSTSSTTASSPTRSAARQWPCITGLRRNTSLS